MLRLLLPAGRQHLVAHEARVDDRRAGLDVLGDHGARADRCAVADRDRPEHVGAVAQRTAAADVRVPSAVLGFACRAERHPMQNITVVADRGLLAYYYSRRMINKHAGAHVSTRMDIDTRPFGCSALEQQFKLPRARILSP